MSRTVKLLLLISLGANILALTAFIVMEKTVQISERVLARLDIDFPTPGEQRYSDLDYLPLTTQAISVHGIAGFEHGSLVLERLGHIDTSFRAELEKLGRHTAGVRIRFKTDSPRLHLPFRKLRPASFSYPYLSEQATSGVDVYIDKKYTLTLTGGNRNNAITVSHRTEPRRLHLVELYLPSFSPAQLNEIGIEPGSRLEAAPTFPSSLAFYGTSITQGASAPRPGLTFPAILARKLGAEFYNYGFSGNGRGDPAIASVLSETNADIYILEYSRQAPGTEGVISENLMRFCKILKSNRPEAAIIIVTALYDTLEAYEYKELAMRRRAFRAAYAKLTRRYSGIYLVEGTDLIGPNDLDHLADTTHPNALGMTKVADHLLKILQPILIKNRLH